jgi:hypothetical protein
MLSQGERDKAYSLKPSFCIAKLQNLSNVFIAGNSFFSRGSFMPPYGNPQDSRHQVFLTSVRIQ